MGELLPVPESDTGVTTHATTSRDVVAGGDSAGIIDDELLRLGARVDAALSGLDFTADEAEYDIAADEDSDERETLFDLGPESGFGIAVRSALALAHDGRLPIPTEADPLYLRPGTRVTDTNLWYVAAEGRVIALRASIPILRAEGRRSAADRAVEDLRIVADELLTVHDWAALRFVA